MDNVKLMIVGSFHRKHGLTFLRFSSDQAFVDRILEDSVDEILTVKILRDSNDHRSYVMHILD
ncbi:hypothetical protein [Methylomonas sp. HYX-M1]|uniref:hypothetical protein n=1 Tax=Methylomonas sp. HYX-M1 TaxID=3139307 RepID=UPI00345C3122